MKDISHYQRMAQQMMDADNERDTAFGAYDEMYHNGWDLPAKIKRIPWIRKVISSDPHDAISGGRRILSTLPVSINYRPMAPGAENEKRANMVDRVLEWQLKCANRRRSASVEADVVQSALLYSCVAVQVIDLDYQIEVKHQLGADTKREAAARRIGRFMINTYNPKDVHVRYSGVMPEAVLLSQVKPAQQVADEWRGMTDVTKLDQMASQDITNEVRYFDYTDYDVRIVWCEPEGAADFSDDPRAAGSQLMVLVEEKNPLPFLNWVCLMGGSTLESEPQHKYQPLLYPIYMSGAWDTQNILKTLMASEAIALTGSPRLKEEGGNFIESAEVDYDDPARVAKVPPGNTLEQLQPPALDQALQQLDTMFSLQIDKSTVSRILMGGELPAGLAFATLNLATQTAVGALKPTKSLSEKALSEICTLMLLWVEFTDKPIGALHLGPDDFIDPKTIDPVDVFIECELHPDVPTDRQQRINAAAMAVDKLFYPVTMALEDIGVQDPRGAMLKRMKEMWLEHRMQMFMMQEQMQLEMQMQQQMAQFQMQQSSMLQEGAEPGLGGSVPRGQGFNPALQGEPPAIINPNETREMVRGFDFLGTEMAE